MKLNIEAVTEIIRNRRSIYPQLYTDQVISDSIIKELLENANWAPTHKLTEPWRFTVFTGKGLQKLADFQSSLYKELSGDEFEEKKYEKLQSKPLQCSHVISIGMKRHAIVPEEEEIASVACVVQNMYLTACAHGLGCYWGSGGITYKKEANAFFGLEEEDKLLGFFFLGYPKIEVPKGRRTPISEKVRWEK